MTREPNLVVVTVLPVVVQLGVYHLLASRREWRIRSLALYMCIGLYVVGPLFIMIGATALHGGFSKPLSFLDVGHLVLFSVFPPLTLMMVTSDVTGIGFILSTVILLYLYFRIDRKASFKSSPSKSQTIQISSPHS